MSRTRILFFCGAVSATALAVPALASDPASGTLSNASPQTTWTGSSNGYGYYPIHNVTGEGRCSPPVCDSYSLELADAGNLTLTVDNNAANGPGADVVQVDVTKPGGDVVQTGGTADKPTVVKIKNAEKGKYTVEVTTNEQAANDGSYKGVAQLGNPAAPATTPAAGGGTTTPPPASPTPAAGQEPAAVLSLKTRKASAKKARKGLKLTISTTKPVKDVSAALVKGKKVLGKGKLASLQSTGSITVKAKKLKKGSYVVALSATDASTGQRVGLRASLKVVK
jgi:hypothetical protein